MPSRINCSRLAKPPGGDPQLPCGRLRSLVAVPQGQGAHLAGADQFPHLDALGLLAVYEPVAATPRRHRHERQKCVILDSTLSWPRKVSRRSRGFTRQALVLGRTAR